MGNEPEMGALEHDARIREARSFEWMYDWDFLSIWIREYACYFYKRPNEM